MISNVDLFYAGLAKQREFTVLPEAVFDLITKFNSPYTTLNYNSKTKCSNFQFVANICQCRVGFRIDQDELVVHVESVRDLSHLEIYVTMVSSKDATWNYHRVHRLKGIPGCLDIYSFRKPLVTLIDPIPKVRILCQILGLKTWHPCDNLCNKYSFVPRMTFSDRLEYEWDISALRKYSKHAAHYTVITGSPMRSNNGYPFIFPELCGIWVKKKLRKLSMNFQHFYGNSVVFPTNWLLSVCVSNEFDTLVFDEIYNEESFPYMLQDVSELITKESKQLILNVRLQIMHLNQRMPLSHWYKFGIEAGLKNYKSTDVFMTK